MALYRSPDYQTSFESVGISVQRKKLNSDFQDGSHLEFPIRLTLALLILPMNVRVNWPFGSG